MAGAQSQKLKSGALAHEFTASKRSRGGHARAEKIREQRARVRELADEEVAALLRRALERLAELLESEHPRVAARVVREILDRVLGRPTVAVDVAPREPIVVRLA